MKTNLLLAAFGLAASATAQTVAQRPNVIFLVADDLGYGDISCYGATRVQTPCLDSIARGGVRFVDAHTCASTSTPSRYSMLTGEYPFRKSGTGIAKGDESMIIAPEQYTVADVFHEAGYATGAVGKWHLGLGSEAGKQDWNGTLDQHLGDLGFDYHYIMAATADRVPCAFIENGRIANYDASAPIYVSYNQNFPGEPTGKTHPELLTKLQSSHGHNQAIVNGIGRIGYMKGGGKALWQDENIADSIVAHAVRFMEAHADHPFFLYLGTNDVHVPRYPHERFRGKSPMGLRGEAILQFDWSVQQVVNELNRLGIADNTLLIITSDNGPVLDDGYRDRAVELVGDHRPSGPFRGGKYGVYEGGSVVPFIVNWPAEIPGGKESRAMVSLVDNVASMAQLVGVSLPSGAARDSRPQLATWLGKSDASCPFAIAVGNRKVIDIRQDNWKYVEPANGGVAYPSGPNPSSLKVTSQLFDLSNTVFEKTNVAAQHLDQVIYFENLLDSVLWGDYPVSFNPENTVVNSLAHLQKIELMGETGANQVIDLKSDKRMYVDAMEQVVAARAGETLSPKFSYTGAKMNGYVYVDFRNDGLFQPDLDDQLLLNAGSDLISFAYYGANNATSGKNSLGEPLSGLKRFTLDPPAFTLPSSMVPGFYRMRFKVDFNNISPDGSSAIVGQSGRIVDVRLHIHDGEVSVRSSARHGRVVSADGKELVEAKLSYGQPLVLQLVADEGYEIGGLNVKYGYHLEQDRLLHKNPQWDTVFMDRSEFDGNELVIPAAYLCGSVELEGVFVEDGSYVEPEEDTRYMTTTITNGQFAPATSWYSMQISSDHEVLAYQRGADYIPLIVNEVDADDPAHLWCFTGNETDGYRIYNMEAGPGMVLAAPVEMKGQNGSLSYPVLLPADQVPADYVDLWRFANSEDIGVGTAYAYVYEDGFQSNKLNQRGDKLAFWSTGQNQGSTLTIRFVKQMDVTGIVGLEREWPQGNYYDLQGRKGLPSGRGVYVKDGLKIYLNE